MSLDEFITINYRNDKGERENVEVMPHFITCIQDFAIQIDDLYESVKDDYVMERVLCNIRWAIMNELMPCRQFSDLKQIPIGTFNSTHTAFDVLTDYAFGGDKQAALEYLKSL